MARIRTVKPEMWLNEELADLPFVCRWVFAGLLTQADRAGRMQDKPKRLRAVLLPYDSDAAIWKGLGRKAEAGREPMDAVLDALKERGLVTRYEACGMSVLSIPTFAKHQHLNGREPNSTLPDADAVPAEAGTSTAQVPARYPQEGKGREGNGKEGNGKGSLRGGGDPTCPQGGQVAPEMVCEMPESRESLPERLRRLGITPPPNVPLTVE